LVDGYNTSQIQPEPFSCFIRKILICSVNINGWKLREVCSGKHSGVSSIISVLYIWLLCTSNSKRTSIFSVGFDNSINQ
jgi:hypothetical protein